MEITLITYLKAKPLALCTIQIITTIPIIEMYLLHCIYAHFKPKCKYTTIKSRHFQLVKMNIELKSNTSIEMKGKLKFSCHKFGKCRTTYFKRCTEL